MLRSIQPERRLLPVRREKRENSQENFVSPSAFLAPSGRIEAPASPEQLPRRKGRMKSGPGSSTGTQEENSWLRTSLRWKACGSTARKTRGAPRDGAAGG